MNSPWAIAREISLSVALIMALLTAVLGIELVPPADGPVMIITNPFSEQSAMEVIAATEGNVLGAGRWSWIAIAENSRDPEFRKKLKAAGTLFFLPPLTAACVTGAPSQGT
jgi:hypothetical protein